MKNTRATTILTDIRNFTGLFEKFQDIDSDEFLNFISKYYEIQSDIAQIISDEIHMASTGDGVMTIFLSDQHYIDGYAFLLTVHKALDKLCENFTIDTGDYTSFGIGSDSGHIWNIGKDDLNTYVGSVINRTSRIESNTKLFGNTRSAIGYHLYCDLMKHFYPSAYTIMDEYDRNYDLLLNKHPEVVLLSKELMVFYIFEMELKNLQEPLPIFRLSEYMLNDDDNFWKVMGKMLNDDKIEEIKKMINDI